MNNVYIVFMFKNNFMGLTTNFAEVRVDMDDYFQNRNDLYFALYSVLKHRL